ncbi:MAG: carbon starvation CstA family protein [Phycisphaerales bacterium]
MATLAIALGALVGYLIAYHTYGRWLARKIFRLNPDARVPSRELEDGCDYVPTKKAIVFGHHFTSIAGTGPIVGPAIAVIWGWLPALLWVFFGSILIGAVHDFGALIVSLRNRGQTVGDIAGRVLNPRVRVMFLLILFMALTIVLAIFGLVIAAVFRQYPAAIFPCVVQIPIAVLIGVWLHKRGVDLLLPSILALAIMYLTVIFGDWGFLHTFNMELASWPTMTWVVVLLVYSYIASVLPVWALLQPRDYINSLQLLSMLALIVIGLCAAAFIGGAPPVEGADRPPLELAAPMVNWDPSAAPLIFPFLFITIACGAISGFHCLVSSGTSSKQLACETDAQFVGYGSMLTEGFLATLVILACAAGLGLGVETISVTGFGDSGTGYISTQVGEAAFDARYTSWTAAGGLGAMVGAFVDGAANFLKAIGVPGSVAVAFMGVLVASFAGTTLDTACRLQRYVIQELASTFAKKVSPTACGVCGYELAFNQSGTCPECGELVTPAKRGNDGGGWSLLHILTNKHAATLLAIALGTLIAAMPSAGQPWSWSTAGTGGLLLWPMFGATNQLLGGLAFLVIGFWLWRRRLPVWFIVPPMIFMLIMPAWAMIWQLFITNPGDQPGWLHQAQPNWVLIVVALATLVLEAWMIVEALLLWPRVRGMMEHDDDAARAETSQAAVA